MEKLARVLKMRFQVLLPVLVVVVSLLSCTPKVKEASSIPIFSKENAVDTVHMSSLIKDWHYVMLETKPECFMGRVGQISIDDTLLFIESFTGPNSFVFVFSKDGKFIRKIGDVGKARNEYLYIMFWAIDKWNKEVLIGDILKKRLMRYAYDGSFLGDIPVNDNLLDVWDMYVMSKDRLAFKRNIPMSHIGIVIGGNEKQAKNELDKILKSQSRFLVTDRELNLVSRLSDRGIISDRGFTTVRSSIFVNKTIYARDPMVNDTLYRWEHNQFIPECLIYVDDCRANEIDIKPIQDLEAKHDRYMFKVEHMVNDRYFFTIGNKGRYLIDFSDNSIHNFKLDKLKNLSSPNSFYGLFTDKNHLIASRDATAILELKELQKESNIEVSSKEQELYDSLEEDSNPVIFFYELKD